MPKFFLHHIWPFLVLLGASSAWAQGSPSAPALQGGLFLAEADSLSFDAFRALSPDRQLENREEARQWLAKGRDLRSLAHEPREARSKERILRAAIDQVATAVGLCPYMSELWLEYASLSHELGRYDDVEHCLYQAGRTLRFEASESQRNRLQTEWHRLTAIVAYNLGDLERSRTAAEAVLEADGKDAETRLLLARCLIELGEFETSRERLRAFDDTDAAYARSLAVLGILEMRAGRLDVAEETFDRAHRYGMRGATFDNDRGRLYLEMERHDDAVDHFVKAIESVPSFIEARSNLGVALRRSGRVAEAEEAWRQGLEIDPGYGPIHFNLAELYQEQLQQAEESERASLASLAFEHYSLALAGGYEAGIVIERRARLALRSDDLEQAEQDLLLATENPRFSPRVLMLLARVKKQQGRLDIAQNLLEMAVRKGTDDALVYSELGEVRLRRGDFAGAREALEVSCGLQADLLITRVNLSIACLELGDFEAAEQAWAEAQTLDPENEAVLHQRRVLDERRN